MSHVRIHRLHATAFGYLPVVMQSILVVQAEHGASAVPLILALLALARPLSSRSCIQIGRQIRCLDDPLCEPSTDFDTAYCRRDYL